MRARFIVLSAVLIVATATWTGVHSSGRQLQAQLASLQTQHRALLALQSERAQLRASLDALEASLAQREPAPKTIAIANTVPPVAAFTVGEWTPSAAWSNRGQSTPNDALATALWAAAGGDVLTMQSVIELDPSAQRKAENLLDRLPPAVRSSFVTPAGLVASATMKNIPLTDAQIAWYHESDNEHATVALLFGNAEGAPETITKLPARTQNNEPPMLSDNQTTQIAMLSLHRSNAGWKLVVPASAIDRIASQISLPGK